MEHISLTSKILHRLGSIFIGTPHSLGEMPDDFYFDIGDRVQPMPQDIRKREVLGKKILTNFYRLDQTYRLGPIVSTMCFVAILALSLVSVSLIAGGKAALAEYHDHEVKVAVEKQADATKALGAINLQNCTAQVDSINDLSKSGKTGKDWSPDERALVNYASNCVGAQFLAAGGNPVQYHVRRFSQTTLGVPSQQTCSARLADINALTAKDGWRMSVDSDDTALNSFLSSCQLQGFVRTADMNTDHPIYH